MLAASDTSPESHPLHFRSRHRLTHDLEFQAVLNARVRKTQGALMLSAMPNTLAHARLGLAVGTRVGNAVVRNRCKRMIREAFRLEQHALPKSLTGGYDLVVGLRGGAAQNPLTLVGCRRALVELTKACDQVWRKRGSGD